MKFPKYALLPCRGLNRVVSTAYPPWRMSELNPPPRSKRKRVIAYLGTVVLVGLALLFTLHLRAIFLTTPNWFFFCAIILAAWAGGLEAAIVASVLSSAAAVFWLPTPVQGSSNLGGEIWRSLV